MHIGFLSLHKLYNNNRMFLDPSSPIGDNLMYPFFYMGKLAAGLGHKAETLDMDEINNFDAVVLIDFPTSKNKHFSELLKNNFKNLYLITSESPIINRENFNLKNHKYFKKIFTWSDDLIDSQSPSDKKYFKLNYCHKIPENLEFNQHREKLCALIASNKFTAHPKELYSERIKAIRWFEKNHPEDFDLYGKGWDRHYFHGSLLGINLARLNKLEFLAKIFARRYPSYKGSIKSKNETYQNYKFAICYENVKDFPGYITEKIFDCFLAGCVPIYLGASNITRHIPKETFIDKRNFKTYEELYSYIKTMPDQDYFKYQNAIAEFLKSDKSYQFSAECFAKTLFSEIKKD
jgi:hypothetical protein